MKKQVIVYLLCFIIFTNISGCYGKNRWLSTEYTEDVTASDIASEQNNYLNKEMEESVNITIEESEAEEENQEIIRRKYAEILSHIYYQHRLIDGTDLRWNDDAGVNRYAIYDFDGDGKEELLFSSDASAPVVMGGIMYAYNPETDEVKEEYLTSIIGVIYDNGIIRQAALHNHSLGLEFWPYNLYEYDKSMDEYVSIGFVTAWEKDYMESNEYGMPFPMEQDLDGDGVIYYILDDETAYTKAEYEEWEQNYFNGATAIDIPWQSLDVANFQEYLAE